MSDCPLPKNQQLINPVLIPGEGDLCIYVAVDSILSIIESVDSISRDGLDIHIYVIHYK